ncbi:hypothetical protein [Streptomyces griseorubiginosus]
MERPLRAARGIPQLFSAAGHTDPSTAGANVSRVAGLGAHETAGTPH